MRRKILTGLIVVGCICLLSPSAFGGNLYIGTSLFVGGENMIVTPSKVEPLTELEIFRLDAAKAKIHKDSDDSSFQEFETLLDQIAEAHGVKDELDRARQEQIELRKRLER